MFCKFDREQFRKGRSVLYGFMTGSGVAKTSQQASASVGKGGGKEGERRGKADNGVCPFCWWLKLGRAAFDDNATD